MKQLQFPAAGRLCLAFTRLLQPWKCHPRGRRPLVFPARGGASFLVNAGTSQQRRSSSQLGRAQQPEIGSMMTWHMSTAASPTSAPESSLGRLLPACWGQNHRDLLTATRTTACANTGGRDGLIAAPRREAAKHPSLQRTRSSATHPRGEEWYPGRGILYISCVT